MTFIFPYVGNVIIQIDEFIFFRGVGFNHQPEYHQMICASCLWLVIHHPHHLVEFWPRWSCGLSTNRLGDCLGQNLGVEVWPLRPTYVPLKTRLHQSMGKMMRNHDKYLRLYLETTNLKDPSFFFFFYGMDKPYVSKKSLGMFFTEPFFLPWSISAVDDML